MLAASFGQVKGAIFSAVSLFCGIAAVMLIEGLLPEKEKKEFGGEICDEEKKRKRLLRSGIFTALTIAVHNLPEGLATFVSALDNPKLAVPVVAAVAIHNIPEGIAVSTPVFFATGSRSKAFWYSFCLDLPTAGGDCGLSDAYAHSQRNGVRRSVRSGCGNHALHSACGAFAVGTRAVAEKVCGKRGACCGYADNGDKPDFVYVNATKNARKPRVLFLNLFFQIMLIWQARMASMAFLVPLGSDSRAAAFHDVYFRFG